MRSVVNAIAHLFGFEKDPDSPSNSEDDDDWGDDNPRITLIKEQLEYYFSGINLEKDKDIREQIEQNEDGAVSVDYFLKCNRMKLLEATASEILEAGHNSPYLESDNEEKTIRSKEPFQSDPNRYKRILRVFGIGKKVPQYAQMEFFRSIFKTDVDFVYLVRKEVDGELVYSNESLIEFKTVELANEVLENGIVYGNQLLDVKPYYSPNNRRNKKKRQQREEEEQLESESYTESDTKSESESEKVSDHDSEEDDIELRPERDASDEAEPEQEAESESKQEAEPESETKQEEPVEEEPKKRGPKKRGPKGRAAKPSPRR